MKKNDLILVIIVLTVCITSFLIFKKAKTPVDTVTILYNGTTYCEKPLSENCVINVNNTNTVKIENGEVYMQDADCPDKVCIHMGKISDSSKNIICLPNKVIVTVSKKSNVDTVVR